MAKRNVLTMVISLDTKDPSKFITDVKGNGLMPTEDLIVIIRAIADSLEENNKKTVGEYFGKGVWDE